jgi:hypothetical protein
MIVRFVSVVLKVVMQNEGDVVDVTLLYLSKEFVELRVHCQFSWCVSGVRRLQLDKTRQAQ